MTDKERERKQSKEDAKAGERLREGEHNLQFIYSESGDYFELYSGGFSFKVSSDVVHQMNKVRSTSKGE